ILTPDCFPPCCRTATPRTSLRRPVRPSLCRPAAVMADGVGSPTCQFFPHAARLRTARFACEAGYQRETATMTSVGEMLRSGMFESSTRDFLSADTLPPQCYTSSQFHEFEVASIFH